jgi:hypothetical protein
LELPGDHEAREWAVEAVHEIRAEDPNTDWAGWRVDVLDASGNVLISIPVTAPAFTMNGGSSLH